LKGKAGAYSLGKSQYQKNKKGILEYLGETVYLNKIKHVGKD